MRFISPIAGYRLIALHETTEPLADGTRRSLAPGFTAEFKQSDTTNWERDVAREKLKFKGTTKYLDGTPVDPITRVSSFDTATIEDTQLRHKVEKAMLDNPDFGKQDGYILVEKPQVPAPWPTYDEITIHGRRRAEHVAEQNLAIAAQTGVPIDALIAYERQADEPREDVIVAYEAAAAAPEAEQPELVEA